MPDRQRATYLAVDEIRRLDHWCHTLGLSFGREVWLVGSVLTRPDYRDVDLRIALADSEMDALPLHAADLNMMLSMWGRQAIGLPIDCQVQRQFDFENDPGPVNPRGHIEDRRR